MALIVEDGTGLVDSDSYISLADARTFAANYGFTLPVDDTEAEIALRKGAGYVDLQEGKFCGNRLVDGQALSWPRTEYINKYDFTVDAGSMPVQLGYAQVAAADEFGSGTDVRATDDGKSIASEEVTGAVAVSYFNNGKTGSTVTITKCLDLLQSLFCSNSAMQSGLEFRVSRG